jgi:hypothetical protein
MVLIAKDGRERLVEDRAASIQDEQAKVKTGALPWSFSGILQPSKSV